MMTLPVKQAECSLRKIVPRYAGWGVTAGEVALGCLAAVGLYAGLWYAALLLEALLWLAG